MSAILLTVALIVIGGAWLFVAALVWWIAKQLEGFGMTLDDVLAKVAVIEGRADSLIELVTGLAQLLRDSAGDPAKVQEIADRLDAQSGEIQAALEANPLPTP